VWLVGDNKFALVLLVLVAACGTYYDVTHVLRERVQHTPRPTHTLTNCRKCVAAAVSRVIFHHQYARETPKKTRANDSGNIRWCRGVVGVCRVFLINIFKEKPPSLKSKYSCPKSTLFKRNAKSHTVRATSTTRGSPR